MKLIQYSILFLASLVVFSVADFYPTDCANDNSGGCTVETDCSWNGIPLYGKVQFVESFPDIKIEVVESFPDLRVQIVESFPDECGKWQVVESFPDFKVQVVESFGDIKVEYVEGFPGME